MSRQKNPNAQKMGMSLRQLSTLKIHQTITLECRQHALCEDCYRKNSDGPICGILYAPEIKEIRKLKLAFPATFEDYCLF